MSSVTIKEQISQDLKEAMKAREQVKVDTLRSALSAMKYKENEVGKEKVLSNEEELAVIQKELAGRKDFLEQLEIMKIDLFKDRIFVFTPNGDVIDLPEGATPVDFAYAIHTDIGNTCVATRINDILQNLDTTLKSGDVVEIVTDKNRRGPNADWLKYVRTRHARNKIKDATRFSVRGWLSSVVYGRKTK